MLGHPELVRLFEERSFSTLLPISLIAIFEDVLCTVSALFCRLQSEEMDDRNSPLFLLHDCLLTLIDSDRPK